MTAHIDTLLVIARILAALSLVTVLATLVHLWRRPAVPAVSYGGIELGQRRLRWLWTGALVGGVLSSGFDDPIAIQTSTMEDPERVASAVATRSTNLSMPLPFLQYSRSRTWVADAPDADLVLAEETVTRGITLPRGLFAALVAYGVLVVWWNPESRWARRILHGKRRRFFGRGTGHGSPPQ